MARRKMISKRMWLRRFLLGRPVPATALVEYPSLKLRIERAGFESMEIFDAVRRKA